MNLSTYNIRLLRLVAFDLSVRLLLPYCDSCNQMRSIHTTTTTGEALIGLRSRARHFKRPGEHIASMCVSARMVGVLLHSLRSVNNVIYHQIMCASYVSIFCEYVPQHATNKTPTSHKNDTPLFANRRCGTDSYCVARALRTVKTCTESSSIGYGCQPVMHFHTLNSHRTIAACLSMHVIVWYCAYFADIKRLRVMCGRLCGVGPCVHWERAN